MKTSFTKYLTNEILQNQNPNGNNHKLAFHFLLKIKDSTQSNHQ